MKIPIHFENQNLLIAIKPCGYLSVPSRFAKQDQRPVLGRILEQQLAITLFPVHRLDFEVSGLIIFAKTREAHRLLNSWFEQKKVTKKYHALTTGQAPPEKSKFEWRSKVLRGKKRTYESVHGQDCLTLAEFQQMQDDFLLWHLQPVTGRAHQLRFDLARHQFPIVGDVLYGSPVQLGDAQIKLTATELVFPPEAAQLGLAATYQLPTEDLF